MSKAELLLRNGAPMGGSRPATPADQGRLTGGHQYEVGYYISTCEHCNGPLIWRAGDIVYPREDRVGPAPADDMPKAVAEDYNEARDIAAKSSRGAAAILRLALQKLCQELGEKGENLNEDIGSLVQKGLSTDVQQALDALRVIGNNAVHPGELDIRDDRETVVGLMSLLNYVVEALITEPARRKALFDKLPAGAQTAIAKRDKKEP